MARDGGDRMIDDMLGLYNVDGYSDEMIVADSEKPRKKKKTKNPAAKKQAPKSSKNKKETIGQSLGMEDYDDGQMQGLAGRMNGM